MEPSPVALPPASDVFAAFSAQGVISATDVEIHRRHHTADKAAVALRVYAAVAATLEDRKAVRAFAAAAGSGGVRGLTGNAENWLESISVEYHKFAQTVFSDEAASVLPPFRPDHDCVITVREGEVLRTSKLYDMSQEQHSALKALLDVELAKV